MLGYKYAKQCVQGALSSPSSAWEWGYIPGTCIYYSISRKSTLRCLNYKWSQMHAWKTPLASCKAPLQVLGLLNLISVRSTVYSTQYLLKREVNQLSSQRDRHTRYTLKAITYIIIVWHALWCWTYMIWSEKCFDQTQVNTLFLRIK